MGKQCLDYANQIAVPGGVTEVHLQLHGVAAGTFVFPEVTAFDGKGGQLMLPVGSGGVEFDDGRATRDGNRTSSVRVRAGNDVVGSTLLYGRAFFADDLAYVCPGGSSLPRRSDLSSA